MENFDNNKSNLETNETTLDKLERKLARSCFFSWLAGFLTIIVTLLLAAYINEWILLGIFIILTICCYFVLFFGYRRVRQEFNKGIYRNHEKTWRSLDDISPTFLTDTDSSEETLWSGRQPTMVRAKKFAKQFRWVWAAIFLPVIIGQIIVIMIKWGDLMFYIVGSFLMAIIFYLAMAFGDRWSEGRDEYIITTRKVRWEREEEWAEILLHEVTDLKVVKRSYDVKELNTGSIFLKDKNYKKFWLEFLHIEQVDEVAALLEKILPNLGKEFLPIEPEDAKVPDDVTKYFSKGEELLFTIKNRSKERMDRVHKWGFIGTSCFIAVYTPLFFMFSDMFNALGVIILILGPVIAFMIILDRITWFHKSREQYIYLTNKKLYVHKGYVKEIKYAALKAINLKRRGLHAGEMTGDLTFLTGKRKMMDYEIKNIPDILFNLKVIESVLYKYGHIEKRWQSIKNKMKLELPATFQISADGLSFVSKRMKQLNRNLVLTILLSIVIISLFYYFLPPLGGDLVLIIFLQVLILVLGIIFTFVFVYYILLEKYRMKKGTEQIDKVSVLSLHSDHITLSGAEIQKEIPLRGDTIVNIIKIQKPLDDFSLKWSVQDGLKIESKGDSIYFGPLDNNWDVYEALFCYLILWKADHELLIQDI